MFRDLWDDETQREMVIESLKADCQDGEDSGSLRYAWGSGFCTEG
jgi:hypothetical protein